MKIHSIQQLFTGLLIIAAILISSCTGVSSKNTDKSIEKTPLWAVVAATREGSREDVKVMDRFTAMGRDFGNKLIAKCDGRKPGLVIYSVFDSVIKTEADNRKVLDGIAQVIDKNIVYGMPVDGGLRDKQKNAYVIGMAFSEGFEYTAVKVRPGKDKEADAYTALAEKLKKPYNKAEGQGRLVMILGACAPVPFRDGQNNRIHKNNAAVGAQIIPAFQKTLGEDVQLFGTLELRSRKHKNEKGPDTVVTPPQIFMGEMYEGSVMALLLTGDFTCDFAIDGTGASYPWSRQRGSRVLELAKRVMNNALGEKRDDIIAIITCTHNERIHAMEDWNRSEKTRILDEKGQRKHAMHPLMEAARTTTGAYMNLGEVCEIGHEKAGKPAKLVRNKVTVCVIRKQM